MPLRLTQLLCSVIEYLLIIWAWITLRRTKSNEEDIESIIVPYPILVLSVSSSSRQPEVAATQQAIVSIDVGTPGNIPGLSTENDVRAAPLKLEQRDNTKELAFVPSSPVPPSPCPSLSVSIGSSASTVSVSFPATPVASPRMEQLEVRTGDFEDASLVKNAYRVYEISRPVPSDLDVPDVASNLNLGLLAPSPPCPTPLARRSSNLVPIYAPSACGRQVSPSPSLTHTPDPFGAFAESYFADEPKGSVVHANAVPDLYNFDVYAPSSTPPRRQRTRENRETREVNATERPTFVSSVLQVPTGQQDTTHPAARQGLDEIACKVPAENRIEDPPKLRTLLLPQEVERRELRDLSPATTPTRGIRPLMLPLHVAMSDSTADASPALLQRRPVREVGAARPPLLLGKPPVSYPSLRNRPLPANSVADLEDGSDTPGDAIEIAEKEKGRSQNISDDISLLHEIGVTDSPRGEDRLQVPVAADGTVAGEAAEDALGVPILGEFDGSQGKQEGIRAGGLSAAFDGGDGDVGYSRKLGDIVTLLDRPASWNAVPRNHGLEHEIEVKPREQLHKWGYAI